MATLEEVQVKRRERPLTATFFFTGKSKEMFIFLFGQDRWKNEEYVDITWRSDFDFDRALPMPEEIRERRNIIALIEHGNLHTEEQKVKLWNELMQKPRASASQWTLSKWGVNDTRDIHVRFGHVKCGEEIYLKVMFLGLHALPFSFMMEMEEIGIQYDLYWVNELTQEYGGYSSKGSPESDLHQSRGLHDQSLDSVYNIIFDHDLSDIYSDREAALDFRKLLHETEESLKEFLVRHPLKEWEDNRARIFFVKQPLREAYTAVDKVIDYLDQRMVMSRQELWAAELAIHKLLLELEKEDGDRGFVYYQLLNLIRYGLEVTQKVLAG